MCIGGTVPSGLNTTTFDQLPAISTCAFTIEEFLIVGTHWLTETTNKFVSRFTKTLVRVTVIIVARRAESAHTFDSHIGSFTDTLLSKFTEEFIDTLTRNSAASLSKSIIRFSLKTFRTCTLNKIVTLSTDTFVTVEIVDLIGAAFDSADSLIDIIELTFRASSTVVVDKIKSRFTNTSISHKIFIDITDRSTHTVASLTMYLMITFNTITTSTLLIIDLSSGITL